MNVPAMVLVDGLPVRAVPVLDRGLHYGDGLFETVIVRRGRARFAALHAARLERGRERLGIPPVPPPDFDALAGVLGSDGVLKLMLTRGDARARGYGTTDDESGRTIVLWYPDSPASGVSSPSCRATWLRYSRWGENPALAGLKHLNRLEQVLARRELAQTADVDEGLVRSSSGDLVSGTQSNVFIVNGSQLTTPRIDRCGIAGVIREVVLREAHRFGLTPSVIAVDPAIVDGRTSLFFTNARVGVWPVVSLDGRPLPVPEPVLRLRELVESLDA